MLNLDDELTVIVDQRLKEEEVIWMTTVTPGGSPQPNPVWFLWDGEEIILYSKPDSYRIRNLQHNNAVSLNLQDVDVMGNNVIVICGEASMFPGYLTPHPDYVAKYEKYLPEMNITMEQLAKSYSIEIRIKPTKIRC
jgi:PPOX class probable F420-dependent enzyme